MAPGAARPVTLRYAAAATGADLARAAAGLAVTAGPLLMMPLAWPATVAFGAAAALFLAFALQAFRRAALRVTFRPDGLEIDPGRRRLAFADVEALSLAYYTVRRDGERGWFELMVRGAGCTLRVDSRLEGFDALVGAAAGAALRRGVELDAATRDNLAAILGERTGGAGGE